LQDVLAVVASTLGLGARAKEMSASSPLLGAVPELDSMAVVSLLTALEDRFGICIEDDDVSAENLKTLGALVQFVERKLSG
jgi:acyl carrier protein